MHIERHLPNTTPPAPALETQKELPGHVIAPSLERRRQQRRRDRAGGRRASDEQEPEGSVRRPVKSEPELPAADVIASEFLLFSIRHRH